MRGRPLRLLIAVFIAALVCAAVTVEAQRRRGGGGGRGGFGFGTRTATPQDFDGLFHFCRIVFRNSLEGDGGGWSVDYPRADINLSVRLSELTKTNVSKAATGEPNHLLVRLTDDELFDCPFAMMTEPGGAGFDDQEAAKLRLYLEKGGFLWADDFWGEDAFEDFAGEIGKVLPRGQYPIKDLPPEHPIYRVLFPLTKIPQVPSIQFWRQSGGETSEVGAYSARAHMAAIVDSHERIMVLMTHNTDIADSWEREGDDPQFFFNFSPNGYAVGLNSVLYAMSH